MGLDRELEIVEEMVGKIDKTVKVYGQKTSEHWQKILIEPKISSVDKGSECLSTEQPLDFTSILCHLK